MNINPLKFTKGKGTAIFVGDVHAPIDQQAEVAKALHHIDVKIVIEGDIMDTYEHKKDKVVKVDWERWGRNESFFKRHLDKILIISMWLLCIIGWTLVYISGRH